MKMPSLVKLDVRFGTDFVELNGLVEDSNLYDILAKEINTYDFLILKGTPDFITFNAEKVFGHKVKGIPIIPGWPEYDGTNEN